MISVGLSAAILFSFLIVFLISGVPIAFCTMLASVIFLVYTDLRPIVAVAQSATGGMNQFALLAVPMFMLAGYIMEGAGISERLVGWVKCMFGKVRGSVGIVTIISCAIFAALTGSSTATVAAIGAIMMPSLIKTKYPRSSSAGMLAAGGCLGPIIPPSIAMLIYGSTMRLSIPAMFLGGLLPGVLLTIAYLLTHGYLAKNKWRLDYEPVRYTAKEKLKITWHALPAIFMPVIILGGIYGGIFTPTESAAIAVAYAVIVGFVTRVLTVKTLIENIKRTTVMGAAIALSVGCGLVFTYLMSTTGIPTAIAEAAVPLMSTQFAFLAIMTLILFIAGCLLEQNIVIIILAPIIVPVGLALGIDALHLGIAFCVNIVIGGITPPFGSCLFTATRITGESYESVVKGVLPFLLVALVTVIIVTFAPFLTTFLPKIAGLYRPL